MKKIFLLKLFILELILGTLTIFSGAYYQVHTRLNQYHNKFYDNIAIGGIDIGDLSLEEARNLVFQSYLNPILESELSFTLKGHTVKYPLENFILTSNFEDIIKLAYEYPNSLNLQDKLQLLSGEAPASFELNFTYNEKATWDLVNNLADNNNTSSHDASIVIDTNGNKIINPHQNAYTLDTATLASDILTLAAKHSSATINLDGYFLQTPPAITTSHLEAIDTLVASYSTEFTTGTGNATNITLASQHINGILLQPGDVFSFNDVLGNTTLEKGYTYAPVIVNAKLVQGVGGGVCQVSSTLYNAVLMLGLTPIERQPHSKPSSYVPLGQDATIDWGNIDFKFKNTFNYPLYIISYTRNGTLYVDLYSNHSLKDIDYKLLSTIDETLVSPINYIRDASLPSGLKKLSSSGTIGYKVTVKREGYRNKQLVSSEIISHDVYKPLPTVYKLGTH